MVDDLKLLGTPQLNIAKELIKLAARQRKSHAHRRAAERASDVDQQYLDALDRYVGQQDLPNTHYYAAITAGAPGTVRGYAAFKPTGRGPVLATVLSPGMVPKGKSLHLHNRGAHVPHLNEMDRALNSRIQVNKVAEYAPGIPDKKETKRIPFVTTPEKWDYVIHDHHAERAGRHYDLRLCDKQGNAHSWAMRYWPLVGERRLAVQQPTHTRKYMKFQGVIEDGYGKGMVNIWKSGVVEIVKATNREVLFHLAEGRLIHEFALIRTRDNQWLLINKTPTRDRFDVPRHKPAMHETTMDDNELLEHDDYIALSKLDGAHAIVSLHPTQEKQVRVFSYRTPKTPGRDLIEYTHKIGPKVYGAEVPNRYKDTVLRGEVWAADKEGKPHHSSVVAGLLNANLWKSRDNQAQKGHLRTTVYDVVKHRGKDVSELPFPKKLEMLREIVNDVDYLELPTIAETKEQKKLLVAAVKNDPFHETEEGIVLQPKSGGRAVKAKIRPDYDVFVRKIFEAKSKAGKPHGRAGGFEYSWERNGPIVGRVGTGFTHAEARDMWQNKDKYIGRVAKVFARTKYNSGALGEPAFHTWHIDK